MTTTATNPVWLGITNAPVLAVDASHYVASIETGHAFVPKTPETFTYDADGNLLSDGRWNYFWDAENRLVRVESRTATPQQSWRTVQWQYDALGRRIRQTTWTWNAGSGTWVLTEDLKFVSDPTQFGRHIAELRASDNALVRTYVWGLDLSGTEQGAGGVGGLLWLTSFQLPASSSTYFAAYDGNGNVAALVHAPSSMPHAHYEYGPFGEPIRVSGPAATLNPFRFSTERTDNTTDLSLYEYRVYNPSTGRWPNRDPVRERGGRNLYAFVRNNPINLFDYLGLAGKKCTEAIGKNGQPRIIFDPAPPKGGWKVSRFDFTMNPEDDTYDGIAMTSGVKVRWSAEVAVLCKCDSGCYETRHGTRVADKTVNYEFLAYQLGGMPLDIPTPTTLVELIGEGIAAVVDWNLEKPISMLQSDFNEIASRVRATKPTKPTDGAWKGGKSPCN